MVAVLATELKAMPQILSTHVVVVPAVAVVCASGFIVFVAHGIVIQSVEQEVPTTVPGFAVPPVTLNDIAGVLAARAIKVQSVLPS